MTPPDPGQLALGFGFAMLAIAILTWIAVMLKELPEGAPGLNKFITRITNFVFDAAPAQADVKKSNFTVRLIVERIIPIIFWLLIIVPMVVFPIILVVMPILHIPWSVLLPPTP